MKKLILVLFTILFCSISYGQEWELIGDNDEFTLYVRSHSKNSSWYKYENKKLQKEKTLSKEFKFKTLLCLYQFDCNKKKSGLMAESYYDEKGKLVHSVDYDIIEMEYVRPDSLGERMLNRFCKGKE